MDEHGRRWETVREAFWIGRLGMPPSLTMEEHLERLITYLAVTDHRVVHVRKSIHDLFAGEQDFERFYRTRVLS